MKRRRRGRQAEKKTQTRFRKFETSKKKKKDKQNAKAIPFFFQSAASMLRSGMASSAVTRGGMATSSSSSSSSSSRAALPRRAALRNTSIVSSAVGDSRSVSSIPRALAASACASTSESSQRVEGVSRGLGPVYWQWRRIASSSSGSSSRRRSRRATVSASAPSSKEIGDGDAEEDDDDEQQPSTSSSSGSPSPPDLATLRAKLDAAIEAEDYALAASLRDALRALEDDAVAGVTEANARFYAAFRAADIDVMASCLGFGENVTVIHPGCNAIRGREAVLESWRVIFSGATRAAAICATAS